eukprot:3348414-Amphidinium_carterae.1
MPLFAHIFASLDKSMLTALGSSGSWMQHQDAYRIAAIAFGNLEESRHSESVRDVNTCCACCPSKSMCAKHSTKKAKRGGSTRALLAQKSALRTLIGQPLY